MNKKYKIAFVAVIIILVVALMAVQSYALWIVELKGEEQIVEVGCFEVAYEEASASVSLNNTYPMSDTKGLTQTPYTFTITNKCTIDSAYMVTLNTLTTNTMAKEKMKFAFHDSTTATPTAGTNLSTYATTEMINTDTSNIPVTNLDESIILATGELAQNGTVTYNLYLWIDETAGNEVMNQKFQASVNLVSTATTITESTAE